MARDIHFSTFAEAAGAGPYDERSMLPDSIDLQMLLSRNDRPQPFFLVCQHDSVLVVMTGEGRVQFKDAPVLWHSYVPGDFLYVPAGTPHRILPATESIQYRYKLPESELEAVAWYCEGCGTALHRDTWELAAETPQAAYLRACTEFNADASRRRCTACGAVHPAIDLAPYRWAELARAEPVA
jgi:hypothetical protein